jgi:hypothetical protein
MNIPSSISRSGRFRDDAWRRLAQTSGCALLHLRLGTVRPDGKSDGLVVNGAIVRNGVSSRVVRNAAEGGGDERTIAFIRYHSHLRGAPVDVNVLRTVPALIIAGGNDAEAGTDDAEALWRQGRSVEAPWTFAIEPDAAHANEASIVFSHELILPWIAAVLRQRLEPGSARLRPVAPDTGWRGDDAGWLPNEAAARGWRKVVRGTP